MSTLGDLRTRIYDEIHQTLSTAVLNACLDAVKFYQDKRFYFNETTVNINLSLTTQYALSIIPKLIEVDTFKVYSSSTPYLVNNASWHDIELWDSSTGSSSTPTDYSIHHEQLRIYPRPSVTLSAQVSYHKAISMSASNSSSTVWTNEASDLIRYRAKGLLYASFLLDPQQAQVENVLEAQALNRLFARTTKLVSSNRVKGYL
ncbi:MAG: hypothetical protein HQK87_11785 [Nitrospinae bacterium]|nr:hypothetical protein [Nitrospinota bacterium]